MKSYYHSRCYGHTDSRKDTEIYVRQLGSHAQLNTFIFLNSRPKKIYIHDNYPFFHQSRFYFLMNVSIIYLNVLPLYLFLTNLIVHVNSRHMVQPPPPFRRSFHTKKLFFFTSSIYFLAVNRRY